MLNETSFDARFREREQVTAAVIATAVEAINRAESAQFDAVVAVSWEMVMQRKLPVWATDAIAKGEKPLSIKDIGQRILAGMVLAGRSIEKGQPVPANVTNGEQALAYVTGLDQREIRSNPRNFLSRARSLAAKVLKSHAEIIVRCVSAETWEDGAKAYATFVRESIANSFDGLERALQSNAAGSRNAAKKAFVDRVSSIVESTGDLTAQEIADAITYLNGVYSAMTAAKVEAEPQLLAA